MDTLLLLIGSIGSLIFAHHRVLRYLRFLQQDDYSWDRFHLWYWRTKAYDRKGTIITLSAALASLILPFTLFVFAACAGSLCALTFIEENPRKHGKILLKMTNRAKRIRRTTLGFYTFGLLLIASLSFRLNAPALFWALNACLIQLIPLLMSTALYFLKPGEKARQQHYLDEAKSILAKTSPYVIGITGSYGKTSTKHVLGEILQIALGPTFWPGKGVNTPMGITREIRENLKEGYGYSVVEMAAYGRGSIARLCGLTPPHAAIITSIGKAHLERFGSEENILLTKAELAQAVPENGILVCNGDDVGARRIAALHPKKTTLIYGFGEMQERYHCKVESWSITNGGTSFVLSWQGVSYQGWTSLYGKLALSNIVGAFTMACALGAEPAFVLAAIRSLESIDNRLQPRKDGAITYLQDAYNSNPRGFADALDVMKALPGLRRILVTPGMIELGRDQYAENERVGRLAARSCDCALIVGLTNRDALLNGFRKEGFSPDKLFVLDSRETALEKLAALRRDGDIILIENDLPDIYEAKSNF